MENLDDFGDSARETKVNGAELAGMIERFETERRNNFRGLLNTARRGIIKNLHCQYMKSTIAILDIL